MANSALAAQYNCSGELQLSPRQSVSQCSLPPAGLQDWWEVTPLQHHQVSSHHHQTGHRENRTLWGDGWRLLSCSQVTTDGPQTSPGSIDLTVNCVKLSPSRRFSHLTKHNSTHPPGSPRKPVGEVAAVVSGPIRAREDQKYKAERRRAGQSGGRF